MKEIKLSDALMIRGTAGKLAEITGVSRQSIEARAKNGAVIGAVNGKVGVYLPQNVTYIDESALKQILPEYIF